MYIIRVLKVFLDALIRKKKIKKKRIVVIVIIVKFGYKEFLQGLLDLFRYIRSLL